MQPGPTGSRYGTRTRPTPRGGRSGLGVGGGAAGLFLALLLSYPIVTGHAPVVVSVW